MKGTNETKQKKNRFQFNKIRASPTHTYTHRHTDILKVMQPVSQSETAQVERECIANFPFRFSAGISACILIMMGYFHSTLIRIPTILNQCFPLVFHFFFTRSPARAHSHFKHEQLLRSQPTRKTTMSQKFWEFKVKCIRSRLAIIVPLTQYAKLIRQCEMQKTGIRLARQQY